MIQYRGFDVEPLPSVDSSIHFFGFRPGHGDDFEREPDALALRIFAFCFAASRFETIARISLSTFLGLDELPGRYMT